MTAKKKWIGPIPATCDICELALIALFIDGATKSGPWACMCQACHKAEGIGLGTGRGQLFRKNPDGNFYKEE